MPPSPAVRLGYREPYDWSGLIAFLSARAIPGVEHATASTYERAVRTPAGEVGRIRVEHVPGKPWLRARVDLPSAIGQSEAARTLRALFDVHADPAAIAATLREIAPAGVRVPGAWDPFELAVRAVLGQQISVAGATTLAGRIAERYGELLPTPHPSCHRLFPTAQALAAADFVGIGLTTARIAALQGLAQVVADGRLTFHRFRDLEHAVAELCQLRGIGAWTAQYIAMRALRQPDAFPSGDLALRKAVSAGTKPVAETDLLRMAERWRPWRAYAAMSLWRQKP